MGGLLAVGSATVSGGCHSVPAIVGRLHSAKKIGEFAIVVDKVLPNCLERLEGEQFAV